MKNEAGTIKVSKQAGLVLLMAAITGNVNDRAPATLDLISCKKSPYIYFLVTFIAEFINSSTIH